nr:hypothetical protein [Tanacetum cinerariifolium]
MHERHAGKIGLYTRYFDFANFRLPLSTFLVDIFRYFHINISQLSVIEAAKVSHFETLCRVYEVTPTVGLFRCFNVNSKKNGWMSFIKCSDTSPVCYTKPLDSLKNWNDHFFWVYDFACPVRFSWHTAKNVTRDPALEGKKDEPWLLETIVGHTIPLLLVVPDRGESELDASVDKFLMRAVVVSRQNKEIPLVEELRRLKKRKTIVADAGGPSHPPKKLREDHGTPSGASVGGKSMSHDSITGRNLRTISALQRFIISLDPSHHSGANITEAEVDSFARPSAPVITAATTITSTGDPVVVVKKKIVEPSLFPAESTSAGETDHAMAGLTGLTGSDFLWNVTNGSRLDDSGVCCEMVDGFAPTKLFASICGMEHDQLFIEFNVGATRQMSLSAEVRMRAEYNIREKRRLKSVVEEKNQLLKAKDEEIKNLKVQLLLKEATAAEAIRLRIEASKLETAEKSLRDEVNALNERNNILEKERNALDVKVTDLKAIVVSKECELTDSTAQLTSIKSQNDNLADQ